MNKSAAAAVPRQHRTICLYFCQEEYVVHILKAEYFRSVLDKAVCDHPELFPPDISLKYAMRDIRVSKRLKIHVRSTVNGYHYKVHPSFVMPYMTGFTRDVEFTYVVLTPQIRYNQNRKKISDEDMGLIDAEIWNMLKPTQPIQPLE